MASVRSWLPATVAGLVLAGEVVSYYLGPRTTAPITGQGIAILVTAIAFMITGTVLLHRREPGWWLVTASLFWFAAGAVANYAYLRIDGSFPFPGPADALYLLIYPWAVAGFAVFIRSLHLTVSVWDVLISLTVTVIMFWLLLFPLIIGPSSRLHAPVFTRAVVIAYPVADALLFCVMLILLLAMYSANVVSASYWLVLTGTAGVLISDSVSAYQSLNWAWDQPSAVDLGWFVWVACWALATLVPRQDVDRYEASV